MQLNPFEIKAEIAHIYEELDGIKDVENYDVHYRILDIQEDKNIIVKLLFKEIPNKNQNLTKYLLVRYCPKDELIEKLWGIIKNNLTSNQSKIFALDLLRDIDTKWTYDECNKYLDNPDEFVDSDTKRILDNAIVNPEVQIDFLDFLNSLHENDKVILLNSLANDYSKDELANMLIPVFLSMPESEAGRTALDLLGNSKSQLAYHALSLSLDNINKLEELRNWVKDNFGISLSELYLLIDAKYNNLDPSVGSFPIHNGVLKSGRIFDYRYSTYQIILDTIGLVERQTSGSVSGWSKYQGEDWYDCLLVSRAIQGINLYWDHLESVNKECRDQISRIFEDVSCADISAGTLLSELSGAVLKSGTGLEEIFASLM